MSGYRGIAGCPQCKVPWTVEDWETYLSVKCPQCGRNIGEVAVRSGDGRGPLVILGQELPTGIPAGQSAVGHGAQPDEAGKAAELAELRAYLAARYPAEPERHGWQYWRPYLLWLALPGLVITLAFLWMTVLSPH